MLGTTDYLGWEYLGLVPVIYLFPWLQNSKEWIVIIPHQNSASLEALGNVSGPVRSPWQIPRIRLEKQSHSPHVVNTSRQESHHLRACDDVQPELMILSVPTWNDTILCKQNVAWCFDLLEFRQLDFYSNHYHS